MSQACEPPPLGGRLHPAALVTGSFGQLVPLAVLLFTDSFAAAFAGVALGLTLLSGVVRWLRFRWRLEGGALVIEQGLLSRSRRVIPYERIQSVDLIRKVRHRLLGVVEVRVEAVGGSDSEGRIDALAVADAERLRATLLGARHRRSAPAAAVEQQAAGEELVAMTPRRLVLAGITGGRVGVAAALLGGAQELFGNRVEELFALPGRLTVGALVGLGVALLLGAFGLSVIVTAVVYWDFRVVRAADELRVRRGLLEQRLDTIPLPRVQALRVEQNLLRRPFGLAAVKVDVAGKAGGGDTRDTSLILPLGTRAEAHTLVAAILDTPGLRDVELTPAPRPALRRRLVRAAVVAAVPTAVATALAGPPGLLAALVGLPAAAAALDAYHALGSGRCADVVIGRAGLLVRRTAFVPVRNLQSLALRSSPLQRRAGLATVELQIARGPRAWGDPRLVDLEGDRAQATVSTLAAALG